MILNAIEAGAGPPIALLHGLFGRAGNFGAVQKRLAARHRVLALDLRNHGASPHTATMSYEAMAEDVLETLRARAALPCAIVGHSMGGKVAMEAALDAPAAVSHLVVADIAPVRYPSSFRDYIDAMSTLPLHPGLTRAAADGELAPAVPDAGIRAFLLQNLRFGADPTWTIGLHEIADSLDAIEGWDGSDDMMFPGPAVFVSGARSDYVRPEHRALIRQLFPAARFVTLKDAGHWVHADDPDGFVSVVEAAMV
jgi:esterase